MNSKLIAALSSGAILLGLPASATVMTHVQSQAGAANCFPVGDQDDVLNVGGAFAESSSTSDLYGSHAYASANLATGRIRIYGSNSVSGGCSVAGGGGAFQDLITIDLPDGLESAQVEFSFAVNGESSSPSSFDLGYANLNVDGVSTYFSLGQINLADMYGRTLSYIRTVTDGEEIDIHVYMNASRLFDAGVIDLSHTGAFSLLLPEGATFTSESGVFLSQVGVPEPATWTLMILGFAGAGAALRRRHPQPA